MEKNYYHGINLVIALHNSLTEKQQRHLNEELDEWIVTFESLASELNDDEG